MLLIKQKNQKIINKYSIKKILIIIFFILLIDRINNNKINNYELNKNYNDLQKFINFPFPNKLKNKIRLGVYIYEMKGGGAQRVTALLLNYIHEIRIIDIFLFTLNVKEINEYKIPDNIKRIFLKNENINNLIIEIKKKKINVLLYQFPNFNEINILNKLESINTIFYRHSSIFYGIYNKLYFIKTTYKEYFNSKYIISLIPLENDYIFHKWGITTSILMDNFITYEYDIIIPSDLSSNIIVMLGRADDIEKRFDIGIQTMEYIVKEIPTAKMKIISRLDKIEYLQNLIYNLNLENKIFFVGYTLNPEIYFKNSSLHIFPTLTEAFPMALSEIKIFGIPTILLGLDYLTLSKKGTIIIYDEMPESIAKESLKIMKNKKYLKKLGRKARLSMKRFNNIQLAKKWIKLILSVYNGEIYYKILQNNDTKLSNKTALKILINQVKLIKKRKTIYFNTTIDDFLNFNYLMNFNFQI